MTRAEEAQRDMAAIGSDGWEVAFTWRETEYSGIAGANRFPERLEPGGFLADYDRRLVVPLKKLVAGVLQDVFASGTPANGDTITIGSVEYEVKEVSTDELGACIELGLANAKR